MRKITRVVGMGLFLASMALLSCAPMQKTIVTKGTLTDLKGKWQGWTTFSSFQSGPVLTYVEIANDTLPLQGTITLSNLPPVVANVFPADSITAGNSAIIDFKNGKISSEGTLIGVSGENFLELTYYGGEKQKLEGWFYYWGTRGTMSLDKK
jgi:hypothetical protein